MHCSMEQRVTDIVRLYGDICHLSRTTTRHARRKQAEEEQHTIATEYGGLGEESS